MLPNSKPGDPKKKAWTNSATGLNEVARVVNASNGGTNPPSQKTTMQRPDGLIQIQNTTGSNREEGDVVQLSDYLYYADYQKRLIHLKGIAPADIFETFAVCWEAIPNNEYGWASIAPFVAAKWYSGDSSPAAKSRWGVKPGEYALRKNWPGFKFVCVLDSTNKIALWEREEPPFYLCKADGAITKGSTGTVSIYTMSEVDTTINVTAKALVKAISTTKWCQFVVHKESSYDGLIYPGEC